MSTVRNSTSKTVRKVAPTSATRTTVERRSVSRIPAPAGPRLPQPAPATRRSSVAASTAASLTTDRSAIPRTVRVASSKTSVDASGRRRTVTAVTTRTAKGPPEPVVPPEPGRYVVPARPTAGPRGTAGLLSSPAELRARLEQKMPVGIRGYSNVAEPGTYRKARLLQGHPGTRDIVAGNIRVGTPTRTRNAHGLRYASPMDYRVDPATVPDPSPSPRRAPQTEIGRSSLEPGLSAVTARPGSPLRAKGSRRTTASPPEVPVTGAPAREVLSTTSSATVGPGIKATTHSTVYETISPPQAMVTGPPEPSISPADVRATVDAESAEVERTSRVEPPELIAAGPDEYVLKKRVQRLRLTRASVGKLESSLVNLPPTGDEAPEEMQPELVATMMHMEERGLAMGSPPAHVYDYLFPGAKEDRLVKVSAAAAPAPLEAIVVPGALPADLHATALTKDMREAIDNSCRADTKRPAGDVYAQQTARTGPPDSRASNTAAKGGKRKRRVRREPLLTAEDPPWTLEELEPTMDLIGAEPSDVFAAEDVSKLPEDSFELNELDNSLEYCVMPAAPRHLSRIQLRGSRKPSWFPGYYCALPDNMRLTSSPSEVLKLAWRAVQPDIFSDDSFLIVG